MFPLPVGHPRSMHVRACFAFRQCSTTLRRRQAWREITGLSISAHARNCFHLFVIKYLLPHYALERRPSRCLRVTPRGRPKGPHSLIITGHAGIPRPGPAMSALPGVITALVPAEPVRGLPCAPLGCLRVPGPHPDRRELGSRPSEPLLQVADLRLKAILRRPGLGGRGRGGSHHPFGFLVLLPAVSSALLRLPRQPLRFRRLPLRGGLCRRLGGGHGAARRAAPGPAGLRSPARHHAEARQRDGRRAVAFRPRRPRRRPRAAPRSQTTARPWSASPRRRPPRPRDPPAPRSASATPLAAAPAAHLPRRRRRTPGR